MEWFVMIAEGYWMLGEGAGMAIMTMLYHNWSYRPNTLDLFFDWVPLIVLGSIPLYIGIKTFHIVRKENHHNHFWDMHPAKINKSKRNLIKATRLP